MMARATSLGKIIYGDNHAVLKLKTGALAGEVRRRVEKISALLGSPSPPELILNRHCGECERSEERRVGKECRSRWAACDSKKRREREWGEVTVELSKIERLECA